VLARGKKFGNKSQNFVKHNFCSPKEITSSNEKNQAEEVEISCRKSDNNNKQSWMESVFSCIKPVLGLIGRDFHSLDDLRGDSWEIPFEIISDLEWLGSGAQGAVFSGKLGADIVAIKKVKDVRETDIKHLRKLNHDNIVKFK
jgi:hypothetical protein